MIAGILGNPLWRSILLSAIGLLCAYEYVLITSKYEERRLNLWCTLLPGAVLFLALIWVDYSRELSIASLLLFFIGILVRLFSALERPFDGIAHGFAALFYAMLPFVMLNFIPALFMGKADGAQPKMLLMFFVLIWANDTFAYLTGRLVGRTPLFARISPKKTIEGTAGGIILTMIAAWLAGKYLGVITPAQWLITAGIVSLTGALGDLVESMLKRSYNIKDSGHLLPGHGGFLDRFDAAIVAAPFVVSYWFLLG